MWFPQPAPQDHPWRTMSYKDGGGNAMVPHMSGTTLDAQARYAAGVKTILENYFAGKPQTPSDVIVENGDYATKYILHNSKLISGPMVNARSSYLVSGYIPISSPSYFCSYLTNIFAIIIRFS